MLYSIIVFILAQNDKKESNNKFSRRYILEIFLIPTKANKFNSSCVIDVSYLALQILGHA